MKRRTALMGLGLLATGSGATFTSAAFSSQVSPTSDLRVVVERGLIVEPGKLFRTGDATSEVDPTAVNSVPNGETLRETASLFGGIGNDGLEDIDVNDVPAAATNDATNDDLSLEVATRLQVDGRIGSEEEGFIQIRNETTTDREVAILFEQFGTDTVGDQDERGGSVSEADVVDIYEFYDSNGNKISSNDVGDAVAEQTVANTITVGAGDVEQVYLDYDTTVAADDIESAVSGSSGPFGGSSGTADLVDSIRVGTNPSNEDGDGGNGGSGDQSKSTQPLDIVTEGEVNTQSSQIQFEVENSGSGAVKIDEFAVDATAIDDDIWLDDGNNREFETVGASSDGYANDKGRGADSFRADGTGYPLNGYGNDRQKVTLDSSQNSSPVTVTFRAFGDDNSWIDDSTGLEIVESESAAEVIITLRSGGDVTKICLDRVT